jgi:cell wall-associated NlpC family hydrolase
MHRSFFSKKAVLFSLVLLFTIYGCSNQANKDSINEVAKFVENQVASDGRTAEFNAEILEENGEFILQVETDQTTAEKLLKDELTKVGLKRVSLQVIMLPDTALGERTLAIIKNSVANIRYKPSYRAELVTQALLGTPVKVLKKKGGWYRIQTPDHYLGWTEGNRLQLMNEEEIAGWNSNSRAVVTRELTIMRKGDESDLPLKKAEPGSIIHIDGKPVYGKVEVKLPDGSAGVASVDALRPFEDWISNRSFSQDQMLETAYGLLGRPYLWGGTTTKAMDCSGFTKMVYYLNGYQLPRDASQQIKAGEFVSDSKENFSALGKGDFLFFGYKGENGKPDRVVHVAIHIKDGRFINAAGEIKIESLNPEHDDFNKYRHKTFLQARNMTPLEGESLIEPVERVLN